MQQDFSVDVAHSVRAILRMLRPHKVAGHHKIRIGRPFDGGYVMLDAFAGVDGAYSLGINDDVSWDLDIAARGIPIFQYDHTIEKLPQEHPLFHWKKIGLSATPSDEGPLDSLPNLIKANGHTTARSLLLKCDIEGYEWEMLAAMPHAILAQFSQIVLELHQLHELTNYGSQAVARSALANLTASHRVVHVHGNNHAPFGVVGGYPLPVSLELTLARCDLGDFSVSDEVFPTKLDMPCHSPRRTCFWGGSASTTDGNPFHI